MSGMVAVMAGLAAGLYVSSSVSLGCMGSACRWDRHHYLGMASERPVFFATGDIDQGSIRVSYHTRTSGFRKQHQVCFRVAAQEERSEMCFPPASFWYPEADSHATAERIRRYAEAGGSEGGVMVVSGNEATFTQAVFAAALAGVGFFLLCTSKELVELDAEERRVRVTRETIIGKRHEDHELHKWTALYWKNVSAQRARHPRYQIVLEAPQEYLSLPILFPSDKLAHRQVIRMQRFFLKQGIQLEYRNLTASHQE